MSKTTTEKPASGGSYIRNPDGSLQATGERTAPPPGKSAVNKPAQVSTASAPKKAPAKSEG